MKLCIGASSRLIVEEGAMLDVHQIVASRRQVDMAGGYTGMDQEELVEVVRQFSSETKIIRDHGGPNQSGLRDTGIDSFEADIEAGFDGLHIDVCKLPRTRQVKVLQRLLIRFVGRGVTIEVGAEHDTQAQLDVIIKATLPIVKPEYAVIDVGGHIGADRNMGEFHSVEEVESNASWYRHLGVKTKAHNMDWHGNRKRYANALDAYNVAPEFGNVEVEAWLRTLNSDHQMELLDHGWNHKTRWFLPGEGTLYEHSRAGLRYILDTPEVKNILSAGDEEYVRREVRDAIMVG